MFDPENVRVVMEELCEELELKNVCTQQCDACPLNIKNNENIDRVETLFNNEL